MSKLMEQLKSLAENGSTSEAKIAKQLLKHGIDIAGMSAITLGEYCGVSNASVVRFAQNMGYKGYSVFKLDYMSLQKSREAHFTYSELSPNDSTKEVIKKSAYFLLESLEHSFDLIAPEQLEIMAEQIAHAPRVAIFSLGASSMAATQMVQKLMLINKSVLFHSDCLLQCNYAKQLNAEDVAIVVSVEGEANELIALVDTAQRQGCRVIAMTRSGHSTLSDKADHVLAFPYSREHLLVGVSSPQITQLMLFDLLFHKIFSILNKKDPVEMDLRKQELTEWVSI